MKLHWTILSVLILCIVGVIFLMYQSMVYDKVIPEGGLALLSSIATGLIGYEAGKKNE
ncbi:MAG TPA: hypothetical protein VEC16_03965 [Alphaproteobacteria bacterium]|nr:hypothetical protein [Alphaproteobacteria bacterium]